MTKIYGIKNCDTMKKALKWLENHEIEVIFHDYKKQGICETALMQALSEHGWEEVINRRGTTWKKLPEDVQNTMDQDHALTIARDNPSLVKRPLLVHEDRTYLGFKEAMYDSIFS